MSEKILVEDKQSKSRDVWICPECGWPVSWTVYECPNCKYDLDGDEEMEQHRVEYWRTVE